MIINSDGKISLRYDTEANWTNANPILEKGETIIVIIGDKQKLKCGDGVTRYNDLPFIVGSDDGRTITWVEIAGKPTTFAPSSHNHDDRYYTESEINDKLSDKANKSTTLAGYGITNAYTKTETDNKLSGVVHLAGTETITGNKTFNGITTIGSVNNFRLTTSYISNVVPDKNTLSSMPWAMDMWHDHFVLLRKHEINSKQDLIDDVWTDTEQDISKLFLGKDGETVNVASGTKKAFRFTIKSSSFHSSNIFWFEVGVGFSATFSQFDVEIEYSAGRDANGNNVATEDEMSWIRLNKSSVANTVNSYFFPASQTMWVSGGNTYYVRFTFTKTSNIDTGQIPLSCIKGFTNRKGSQGLGREYQYPFDWDTDCNMFPIENNTKNLGSSTKKWNTVYATTFTENGQTLEAKYSNKIETVKVNGTALPINTKSVNVDISGKQDVMTEVTNEEILAIFNS